MTTSISLRVEILSGIKLTNIFFARITLAADEEQSAANNTERYRSGHNEAVLKTVCPQGRVGSNPTLSVSDIVANKRLSWKVFLNLDK